MYDKDVVNQVVLWKLLANIGDSIANANDDDEDGDDDNDDDGG